MYFLIWALCIVTAYSYHTTDEIIQIASQYPSYMYDDILVVDLNAHLPYDTLIVCNEHARELVTGELALQYISSTKTKRRVTIIPVLNVWGRKLAETTRPCLRKNKNGVDTNRNFGSGNHHYRLRGEEYEGPHPFSEKESQLIKSILDQGINQYINIHSGEKSIYIPYDSKRDQPPLYSNRLFKLWKFRKLCKGCKIGQASKLAYKAYGTSVDYATDIGVPNAYTFEIYGSTGSCKDMFNPTEDNLNATLAPWLEILHKAL